MFENYVCVEEKVGYNLFSNDNYFDAGKFLVLREKQRMDAKRLQTTVVIKKYCLNSKHAKINLIKILHKTCMSI